MPIYQLTRSLTFPPAREAEEGVVAIGGDLSPERLMLAYQSGIFPWFNENDPIVWWSPDPRYVLYPEKVHVSTSMKRSIRKKEFKITYNQDFEGVIEQCKKISRKGQSGTWITDPMKAAYIQLFQLGYAKSVEAWKDNELAGGMYGVDLGDIFCGESMFSRVSNASKAALIHFMNDFQSQGGRLLDCQVYSDHLASLGAEEISRNDFLDLL